MQNRIQFPSFAWAVAAFTMPSVMPSAMLAFAPLFFGVLTSGVLTSALADATPPPEHEWVYCCEVGGTDLEVDRLLAQAEEAASGVTSLSSRVRLDTISELTGDQKRRFGNLVYAAPVAGESMTRFRLHFNVLFVDGGNHGRDLDVSYIYDGRYLAEVDRQSKVYQRVAVSEPGAEQDPFAMGEGPLPLPFRFERAQVLERFEVALSDLAGPEGTVALKLTPRDHASIDADVVYLWFDKQTFRPVQARSDDQDAGESKIIRLLKPEWGAALPDGAFDTSPPNDATPPAWSVSDDAP